ITSVLAGTCTLLAGNHMQQFRDGEVFVIGANQPHLFKSDPAYFEKGSRKMIHSLNLFFKPSGFIEPLLQLPEMSRIKKWMAGAAHGLQAAPNAAQKITQALQTINAATNGKRMAAFILLLQLLADSKKWQPFSTDAFTHNFTDIEGLRINDVYQYSMANYTRAIALEEVAALVHLTVPSFCRYFKKHTAKTYIQFLNEVRVNEARKQLLDKKMSGIAAVAYQSGFNNVVNFNRVFKSVTGRSPSAFLQQYRRQSNE
ncbi:MAG TPA: AraC family transcriptional regulator, partial [Chitinophagaceae bacterium]|nr:AraC family transcriptional regulator [Chitinophagaceae bacterium]